MLEDWELRGLNPIERSIALFIQFIFLKADKIAKILLYIFIPIFILFFVPVWLLIAFVILYIVVIVTVLTVLLVLRNVQFRPPMS